MERTEELFNKIEGYLNNTLSAVSREAFENQIQTDKSLALEVLKHKELQEALSDKETLHFREKLKKVYNEVVVEQNDAATKIKEHNEPIVKGSAKKEGSFPYWKIAIAAVFVLGLGTLLWDNTAVSNEQLYSDFYTPFPIDGTTRGTSVDTMETVFNAYANGAYDQVIPVFEENLTHGNNSKLRMYLGNSYLNTQQDDQAAHQFRHIGLKSILYEEAQWYLALTYLKQKVTDSSRYFLKNVIEYKGIHEKKAKRLLEKLK